MGDTMGWMEFQEKYPEQAAELERIYRVFVSFPGNCLFVVEDGRVEVHDLYNMDNTWCCDEEGNWTIGTSPTRRVEAPISGRFLRSQPA